MTTIIQDNPVLEKTHLEFKRFTADEKLQDLYLSGEKAERDHLSRLESARRHGIKEGIEQGIEKNIKNMFAKGLDAQSIVNFAVVAIEKVEQYKK